MKEQILLKRKYLLQGDPASPQFATFYAAQLLNKFGILVDQPLMINQHHVEIISELYGINIPKSFYKNPQDTKYFTCNELLIEQITSYFHVEYVAGVDSDNKADFERIEVFKKVLPEYQEGKDVVFRNYQIIKDPTDILKQITTDLASYTRKWSESEAEEFEWLYMNGYLLGDSLKGKDNAIEMFNKFPVDIFAKSLDQKDVVKLSIEMVGETKNVVYTIEQRRKLQTAALNCYAVPLTKRQAKYFNTIRKQTALINVPQASNFRSPLKAATEYMKKGSPVDAANILSKYGSLLTRNLSWLLSRASLAEAQQIINMITVTHPIVTMQFLQSLLDQTNGPRTFGFYKNRKVTRHRETDYETKYRKSVLSTGMKQTLKQGLLDKVDDFYRALPTLGKVFIDDKFKKIAVPFNTSADGAGLDVVVAGTRQPITEDYIRTFCYWHGIRDVDSGILFINGKGYTQELSWRTYAAKPFGDAALSSGDDRSSNGAEYNDFKLSELETLGWQYGVYQLNAYGGSFNDGTCYCGYQNKSDLNTQAWDAKNMAIKIQLPKANSRVYFGFIIDVRNRELIVINQMQDGHSRVITNDVVDYLKKYMNSDYVDQFNIHKIATLRSTQVVIDPADADVIFSDTLVPTNQQKLIRSTDIEKLVALML